MRKYSFSLTKNEIVKFSIISILAQMRLHIVKCLLLLALCIVGIFVIRWLGALLLFLVFALIAVSVLRTYKIAKENSYGKMRTMWVENGMLITASDTFYEELPCSEVHPILRINNLLMFGCHLSKKRLTWNVMPLRVFSSGQEIDEFVSMINPQIGKSWQAASSQREGYSKQAADSQYMGYSKHTMVNLGPLNIHKQTGYGDNRQESFNQYAAGKWQEAYNQQNADGMGGYDAASDASKEAESELLHINFKLDESRWQQVCSETTEITSYEAMGGRNKVKKVIAYAVSGMIFLYACIVGEDFKLITYSFLLLFMITVILSRVKGNANKMVKRQLNKAILYGNVYGNWDISIAENGVVWNSPKEGRGFVTWDKFTQLIESETAFYLFWEDKRHFIMILKESFGIYGRGEELKRICAKKNVKYAEQKKVKYVPGWAFALAIVVIIAMYFFACIRLGIKYGL